MARSSKISLRPGKAPLPSDKLPPITHARFAAAQQLDAILVIVAESGRALIDSPLPESERWQKLNERARPRAGSVRSTVLANARQTLAVLGYIGAEATAFERLLLAGRMIKEAAARAPRSVGLAALGAIDVRGCLDALLSAALAHTFRLPAFRSEPPGPALERIVLLARTSSRSREASVPDVRYAVAAARGNNLVRWLTALPPNILDSRGYHTAIATLARTHGLSMRWLNERTLRRAGANAFLAVSAANERSDAGIAHLMYRPPRKRARAPDIALVGKGILFDTGGVNLKPHRSMLDMHIDMSGSAVALATLLALAELRAPIAADAWLAITENRIGPNAYRPQEIVRAANGVTIQVIHSDAEGRMVLADTLALAARTRPRFMIDFATLTGACVHALTERMSGVLTNRPDLVPQLVEAGRASGERVWNFPAEPDYDSDLESKVADILQCSPEGKGDQILATRFLGRFVPQSIAWAHVDLSAALRPGGLGHINTDVTGFGVRYALQLILGQRILEHVERRQ